MLRLPDHEPLDPAVWRQAWEEAAAGLAAVRVIACPGVPQRAEYYTGVTLVPFVKLCLAGVITVRTAAGERFTLGPGDACLWAPGTWVSCWHADCPRYLRATIDHDHVFAALKNHERRRRGGRLVDIYGVAVPGLLDPATRGLLAGLGSTTWTPAMARAACELVLWAVHGRLGAAAAPTAGAATFARLRALAAHEPAPDRRDAAAELGIAPETVSRLCRRHGACTWLELVEGARMHRVELLLRGPRQLDAIAERCGFASASHLIRRFRLRHGVTPDAWRRAL